MLYLVPLTPFQRNALERLIRAHDDSESLGRVLALLEATQKADEYIVERRLAAAIDREPELDWGWVEELREQWGEGWTTADVLGVVLGSDDRSRWQPRSPEPSR